MDSVALIDRRRLRLQLPGRRIPSASVAAVVRVDQSVAQCNALWQRTVEEAEALRAEQREAGYADGVARALADMAARLAVAQDEARGFVDAHEARIVELALAVVERVAPHLAGERLVAELARGAIAAMRTREPVRIRVHADMREPVRRALGERSDGPGLADAHVVGDAALAPLDVVIETEAGRVHAGWDDQLGEIGAALRRAAGERS